MQKNLKASATPIADIEKVSYEGQPKQRKMYKSGYEDYFNSAPVLFDDDRCLMKNIEKSKTNFRDLAQALSTEEWVLSQDGVSENEFYRTIIGMESPKVFPDGSIKEGKEFVVAKWGKGFQSPVHGHANGYMHEYMIRGSLLVNTYFMPKEDQAIVRFKEQKLINKSGEIAVDYFKDKKQYFKRQNLIHNFQALENSVSVHYVPEHTRDGRDNGFVLEEFDDNYEIENRQVYKLTDPDSFNMSAGDVFIVRSKNVPEYGNHYIVITNGIRVMKEHGLRPQEKVIPYKGNLLDQYDDDVVLLKLNSSATILFHQFHHMKF